MRQVNPCGFRASAFRGPKKVRGMSERAGLGYTIWIPEVSESWSLAGPRVGRDGCFADVYSSSGGAGETHQYQTLTPMFWVRSINLQLMPWDYISLVAIVGL